MLNFVFHNPTKIIFGKGTISQLAEEIAPDKKVLMTFGGGSIKSNGVYDQVKKALCGYTLFEFGGIEPNPRYETLMKAVAVCKDRNIDFLLAVGGGSVLDGTKFIAAAVDFKGADPWDILEKHAPVESAIPIGSVLTLAATGSESNGFAVISRESTKEKLAFASQYTFPKFSILDPQTTISLPRRQTINGIVDAFVHVCEQYVTFDVDTPLQARQAESILLTLMEIAHNVLDQPDNYDARANLMWCATQALNGLIGCGVAHDWSTHMIGHELTALYGIDHAQSLACVMPAVWRHQKNNKGCRLIQYANRVLGISSGSDGEIIEQAISKTVDFFHSLNMPTRLSDYGIASDRFDEIASRVIGHKGKLGEHAVIGEQEVVDILNLAL
ncbi:MAG: iron-containing alcohol dehydrogenase [Candidatus Auribacterota bacterium]|jgi:NADP-dependent alcohol dehydrogenase|nr:iron-containing alcohol dehydrogenase [Candidatus Auribacterota bacterium]